MIHKPAYKTRLNLTFRTGIFTLFTAGSHVRTSLILTFLTVLAKKERFVRPCS